jgi:hypothetical protein
MEETASPDVGNNMKTLNEKSRVANKRWSSNIRGRIETGWQSFTVKIKQ